MPPEAKTGGRAISARGIQTPLGSQRVCDWSQRSLGDIQAHEGKGATSGQCDVPEVGDSVPSYLTLTMHQARDG